jgi:hypothetical protein
LHISLPRIWFGFAWRAGSRRGLYRRRHLTTRRNHERNKNKVEMRDKKKIKQRRNLTLKERTNSASSHS